MPNLLSELRGGLCVSMVLAGFDETNVARPVIPRMTVLHTYVMSKRRLLPEGEYQIGRPDLT